MQKLVLIYFYLFIFLLSPLYSANQQRPKIGLVLSGGGAKGMAHIGVIKIIEELGIPIDYITGTSMGAVIGSLYAAGYTYQEIDSIAKSIDWDELFDDKLTREMTSIEEKNEIERYILEMDVKDYRLELPQGLIAGQKLSQKLSTLLLHVHDISDFSKLPIPFKCIATDIETGNPVTLERGNLAISVRASMAIPSIFNPVELHNKLLVDGGIIRNFPVSDVKEMGADIVIGVDVGGNLLKKEQLNSLTSIIQQAVDFRDYKVDKRQRKLCNILITPDIHGIDASSFNKVDSIIVRGEIAALEKFPDLLALSDSLNRFPKPKAVVQKPIIPKEFVITNINITGNRLIPDELILQKIYIDKNETISTEKIIDNVQKIYSTKFFKNVFFEIIPDSTGSGHTLKIEVIEKQVNRFKLGIHYDNYLKSALLLNFTARNLLLPGSKFALDLRLSQNPLINVSYYYYTGLKPDIGLGLITGYSNINVADYQFGNQRIGTTKFQTFHTGGIIKTIFIPSLSFSIGLRYEISKMSVDGMIPASIIGYPIDLPVRIEITEKNNLFNIFSTLNFDNINSKYFTKKGSKIFLLLEYIPPIKTGYFNIKSYTNTDSNIPDEISTNTQYENFLRFSAKLQHSFLFSKYFSLTGKIQAGITNKKNIPIFYNYMLGGIGRESNIIKPFI